MRDLFRVLTRALDTLRAAGAPRQVTGALAHQ